MNYFKKNLVRFSLCLLVLLFSYQNTVADVNEDYYTFGGDILLDKNDPLQQELIDAIKNGSGMKVISICGLASR